MATVYEREGTLQINFRYNGKRHRVNTGLPLTKNNRQVCEAQAAALDSAIKRERMGMGKVELAEFFPEHFRPRPTTLGPSRSGLSAATSGRTPEGTTSAPGGRLPRSSRTCPSGR
jgi:hypothetical protein